MDGASILGPAFAWERSADVPLPGLTAAEQRCWRKSLSSEMPLFQDPSHAFSRAAVVAFLENFAVPWTTVWLSGIVGGLISQMLLVSSLCGVAEPPF